MLSLEGVLRSSLAGVFLDELSTGWELLGRGFISGGCCWRGSAQAIVSASRTAVSRPEHSPCRMTR